MSRQDFSAAKFLQGLPEPHLEILSEFSEEAEAHLRLLSRSLHHHEEPTARQFLSIFKAAPAELKKKVKDRIKPTPGKELSDELYTEVTALEKEGDRLPAVLTHEEVRGMLDYTSDHPRNYLIIRLLYAAGLRRSELTSLLVADLSLSQHTLFVRSGKGNKDRYVIIDPETSRLLAEYTNGFPLTAQIFDISDKTVMRVVQRSGEHLGIKERFAAMGRRFGAHSLRHAYATHLYDAGMDIFQLKILLGHHFLSTTETYVHTSVNRLQASYQSRHPLSKGDSIHG